jgi:hypothetical protein
MTLNADAEPSLRVSPGRLSTLRLRPVRDKISRIQLAARTSVQIIGLVPGHREAAAAIQPNPARPELKIKIKKP